MNLILGLAISSFSKSHISISCSLAICNFIDQGKKRILPLIVQGLILGKSVAEKGCIE